MKRIFILIPFVLSGLNVFSQEKEEPMGGDTTKFKLGKTTVIFIDSNPNGEIEFECEEDSAKKEEDWGAFLDLGMNGYMAPDYQLSLPAGQELMELDYSGSWSISFATALVNGADIIKDRLYISPGFGISWNHYAFRNNINISTSNEATEFTVDSIIEYDKYKLRATYLQVPLVLGARIGNLDKPLSLQVGVVGGLKLGSRIKQRYTLDDADYKAKVRDDFNLNPFKLEAIARISIQDGGIFARYSLTTLFEKNKAPEVYPFSIGITFGDFMGK